MVINDIMPVINSGNNWIMFSIMVAIGIRISQSSTIFEVDFINTLLWSQLLMVLARTSITNVLTDSGFGFVSVGITFSASAFTCILSSMILTGTVYASSAVQSEALMAISRFCAFEDDLRIPLYVDIREKETSVI